MRRALAEDVGRGDVTTAVTIPAGVQGRAALVTREDCVVAGLPLLAVVLGELSLTSPLTVVARVGEGAAVAAGDGAGGDHGELAPLLTGERVLLNLVQSLCGTATLTRRYVEAVAGTGVAILDTRKTTPGLRLLQKYAVRMGGGRNHRFGLDDGVLIKDNHVAACGSVRAAVERARQLAPMGLRIEVEVDRLEQIGDALAGGADLILLDNHASRRGACGAQAGRPPRPARGVGGRHARHRARARRGRPGLRLGRAPHALRPAIDLGLDLRARRTARPRRPVGR